MANSIPLTQLKREAEKACGKALAVSYRKLYEMALNGEIPAMQINGRWHVEPHNIRAIAETLTVRAVSVAA